MLFRSEEATSPGATDEAVDGETTPQVRDRFWRGAWRLLCVAVPAVFGGLSLAGYHFTAVQLELRLLGLVGLWGAIDLVRQLVAGWWLPRLNALSLPRVPRFGKGSVAVGNQPTTETDALPAA